MKKGFYRTLLALLLCAAVLLTGPVQPMTVSASVDSGDVEETDDENQEQETSAAASTNATIDQLQNEYDKTNDKLAQLKKEQEKIQSNIASAKGEKEKAEAARNNLAYQITLKIDEIGALEERIANLEQQIELKQENIEDKQKEYNANYQQWNKRVRAMYMQDDGTMLGLLLGSDSFAQFLTRSEYVIRISEHDNALMEKVTREREEIESEKMALEDDMVQVEEDKLLVEDAKKELGVQHQEAQMQVQDMARMEAEYLANLEQNKKLQDAAQAELKKIYDQIQWSKNPYVGGEMLWPLPGHYTVSSTYGSRFGGSDFHTGMDITSNGSGCYGSTIVAANDGTVAFVNTAYTNGVGYGIYVIIDHGGEMSTLYAHCSAITVSLGQEVKKGDPIAKVGSTGWSTGPHLHFEVRKGSKHVEPSQYLKG